VPCAVTNSKTGKMLGFLHRATQDKGKALHIGPIWDYNEAFGMCCGYPITGYKDQVSNNSKICAVPAFF